MAGSGRSSASASAGRRSGSRSKTSTAEGTLDLVTANRGSKTVTVLLNGADAPQPVVCLVPGVVRRKLAVAQRIVGAANCKGRGCA